MRILVTGLVLTLLLGAPYQVRCQENPMSLHDLVQMVLSRNPDIRQQQDEGQIASLQHRQAIGNVLPQANSQAGYTVTSGQNNTPSLIAANALREKSLGVSLRQTLFDAASFSNISQTHLDQQSQQVLSSQTQQQVLLNVISAYFDALASRGEVKVYRENSHAFELLYQQSQMLFKNGLVPELDVKKSRVEYLLQQNSLAEAQRNVRLDLNRLKSLVGMDIGDSLSLQEFSRQDTSLDSLPVYLSLARQHRPELQLADLNLQRWQIRERTARLQHLPTANIDLFYGYDTRDPLAPRTRGWQVSLNMSMPLWHWNRLGQEHQVARLRYRQNETRKQQIERRITREVVEAYTQCRIQQQQMKAMEESKDEARQAVQMARLGYQQGTVTNIDVINTQKLLTQTNVQYLQALYSFFTAKANLYMSAGTLKEDLPWLE